MKVVRLGDPCVVAGQKVDTGGIIDVPADVAKSLLAAGHQSDGTPILPMWAKPDPKKPVKAVDDIVEASS